MTVVRKMDTTFHIREGKGRTLRDVFYEAHRKFKYNPESGELRYRNGKVCRSRIRLADLGCLGSRPYTVRRVIWLMSYGYLPKRLVHANGDKEDNRLENLREG